MRCSLNTTVRPKADQVSSLSPPSETHVARHKLSWTLTTGFTGCTDKDKRNSLLISRVASLGRLRHQPRGYAGPLSRHLLGYNSIINVVRESIRDLSEMSLVTMLLNGAVKRDRDDWNTLGFL